MLTIIAGWLYFRCHREAKFDCADVLEPFGIHIIHGAVLDTLYPE